MTEKIIVLHPQVTFYKSGEAPIRKFIRHPEAALEEAIGLARAINLDVVHSEIIKLKAVTPATLMGSGVVARIKEIAEEHEAGLVFVDHALTPGQQRNLETKLDCKVIDRTGLILEIFGARARTKEGVLQVDLAALSFQRTRLVRAWTHLERQRGGFGFLGGPGESQIELDRRMLDEKIKKLKVELEHVRQNRRLQRESRKKEPYPIVAIVGYTNAGKSTLFNRITGAEVLAQDLLFATLDTTMRGMELPSGKKAILSDTVGFISDQPTHLVAAFRATLEEVQEAAVILHVRDISQENTESEKEDVLTILKDLGIDPNKDDRMIEVLNKTDALPAKELSKIRTMAKRKGNIAPVSALTGEGLDELVALIDKKLGRNKLTLYVDIPVTDGKALSWLYAHGEVVDRKDGRKNVQLKIAIEPEDSARFADRFEYKLTKTRARKKA